MSSIVGIGAALSAVVWLAVFWFMAQAAVQETRSGFIEPPRPTRREKRQDQRLERQLAFRNRSLEQAEVKVAAAARPVAAPQEIDALTWSVLTQADSLHSDSPHSGE